MRPEIAICLILGIALFIRVWGISDRLPDPTLGIDFLHDTVVEETDRTTTGRAWNMWGGGTVPLDLNPHTGGWPALSFYVTLAQQATYKLWYLPSHLTATAVDFARHALRESNGMFLFSRWVGVLIGVASIWLTYLLGARLCSTPIGLIAALLLAVNPLHIQTSQHVSDPNLLALAFVLVAVLAMASAVEGGSARASAVAGAAIGFAGACKYVPLLLVVPLVLAHLWRPQDPKERIHGVIRDRRLWMSLGALFLAMAIATPFTFLDWNTTLRDLGVQRRSLFSEWVGQTQFPISLPTYLGASLPHALGWPTYVLSVVGMFLLWRSGLPARLAAISALVIILGNGALRVAQERYILPTLPILEIAAAGAVIQASIWISRALASRGAGGLQAPSSGAGTSRLSPYLLALALVWPLPQYVGTRMELAKPDARHLSRQWINDHIQPVVPMAVEVYGPVFNTGDSRERAAAVWPFFATQTALVRVAYHPAFLDGLRYVALSSEVSRRFEGTPAAYSTETAYYAWLRAHAPLVWSSDAKTSSGPRIEIRALPEEISTMTERDSLWARRGLPGETEARLVAWCLNMGNAFLSGGDLDRAKEWANRGITIADPGDEARLLTLLATAQIRGNDIPGVLRTTEVALRKYPRIAVMHLYRAMALEAVADWSAAAAEYATSLQLDPEQEAASRIRSRVRQLRGG